MGYANLAACVADLEENGHLRRIDYPVSPHLEMAAIQRRACASQAPALLFTNPRGCAFPMLANLFGTRERANFIFRDTLDSIKNLFRAKSRPGAFIKKPLRALQSLSGLLHMPPKSSGSLATRATPPVLSRRCSLRNLPRLVSWPKDGGPFITLPLVYSEDGAGRANLGMYRVQISGNEYADNEAGLHYQLHRGIGAHHAAALRENRDLPVHVYVGGPPALTLAAIMPLPPGISEILFAGLLGGRRMTLVKKHGFRLPVLAECDFMIQGRLTSAVKSEGPFGDHLGYYSLKHDFPVLEVEGVFHRPNAIWPFTSVGRPPQEDTVFGEIIHELTGPLVGDVFNGIKEIHAVDAAGVHPLLLAVGEERYVPYESPPRPRELLTLGLHLLGETQTALAKYLFLTAGVEAPCARDVPAFFKYLLERTNFGADLHFITQSNTDTLDYTGSELNVGSKLIWASVGAKRRSLGLELKDFPRLPEGFKNPVLLDAGILAIQGPPHDKQRGKQDQCLERELCAALANWRDRENFPLVALADDSGFCAANWANFLWVVFSRSDPAADVYGCNAANVAKHWQCEAPLIIDARKKAFHAPVLEEDPETTKKIEALAKRGGPLEGLF